MEHTLRGEHVAVLFCGHAVHGHCFDSMGQEQASGAQRCPACDAPIGVYRSERERPEDRSALKVTGTSLRKGLPQAAGINLKDAERLEDISMTPYSDYFMRPLRRREIVLQ
jgi:hypothetical protein